MATHEVGHVVRLDARNDGKNYTSCPCSAKNLRNIKEEKEMSQQIELNYNLTTVSRGFPIRALLQKGESARYRYFIDKNIMQNFGETFGDFTLLHYDDDYARKVGFEGGRPVQGALVSCIIVKSISLTFGDSAILRSHKLEFLKPIYPGNEITVELYVLSNTRNKLITMRSRVYIGVDLHYEGETKIKAFDDI